VVSLQAGDDGLASLQRALEADAGLSKVTVGREPRRLHWMNREERAADTLVVTHPSTSTEFLIRWDPEPEDRVSMIRGGPARDVVLRSEQEQGGSEKWTHAYRDYHDDFLDGRAHGFRLRGTFDPDLSRPFFSVSALEKAGLHAPGHDDLGEIRADGHSGLWIPMFAASTTEEVVDWLRTTFSRLLEIVAPPMPAALAAEEALLNAWPERVRRAIAEARDPAALLIDGDATVTSEVGSQVDFEGLLLTFPRDGKWRLAPRARVLLAPAGPGSDLERRRWVVAAGPLRAGGRTITIGVEPVIAINEVHRFDLAPWLWRRGSPPLTEPATWNGSFDDREAISQLRDGNIERGLLAAGLRLDEALTRMARGQVLGVIHEETAWSEEARERLSLMFPSLLMGAGLRYAHQVLRRRSDGLRLFTFSGQRHARKASVVFVPSNPPALRLDWTGSNRRLSTLLWQRPPIPGAWRMR
jgi:hypothetical protein